MLERITHPNGVVTYQSPMLRELGVRHGFSTRIGGISRGAYATLNLGSLAKGPATDDNTLVAENFRRFRKAVGLERVMRVTVRQVHGCEVWRPPPEVESAKHKAAPEADAMISDDPQQMLTIRTADCVPILLASKDGRMVGAVHAGWRGIVAGVIEATVKVMHGKAGALTAAIGPCIGRDHFEVGPEVVEAFERAGLADPHVGDVVIADGTYDRPHIDLVEAAWVALTRAGVRRERIDHPAPGGVCTYRDEQDFYSHRRDVTHRGGAVTGRMAAVIAAGRKVLENG